MERTRNIFTPAVPTIVVRQAKSKKEALKFSRVHTARNIETIVASKSRRPGLFMKKLRRKNFDGVRPWVKLEKSLCPTNEKKPSPVMTSYHK